ncbi:hypothetical protein GCM10009727_03050 [Actinomadura napierensis]|uniref:Uncharacterized protein n=1 Tax=Actinomadura napierensis TaxID=267854 RepID=A0ABP5JKJ7_9ACTN
MDEGTREQTFGKAAPAGQGLALPHAGPTSPSCRASGARLDARQMRPVTAETRSVAGLEAIITPHVSQVTVLFHVTSPKNRQKMTDVRRPMRRSGGDALNNAEHRWSRRFGGCCLLPKDFGEGTAG